VCVCVWVCVYVCICTCVCVCVCEFACGCGCVCESERGVVCCYSILRKLVLFVLSFRIVYTCVVCSMVCRTRLCEASCATPRERVKVCYTPLSHNL
jgi:hypothetical protein